MYSTSAISKSQSYCTAWMFNSCTVAQCFLLLYSFNAVQFFLLLVSPILCESTMCMQSLLENKFVFCRQSKRADAMP